MLLPRAKMILLVMILLPNFHCIPWMDAVLADWQKWVCMHPSQLFASLFSLQIATIENGHVKTEDPKKMDGRSNLGIHWNIVKCLFRP